MKLLLLSILLLSVSSHAVDHYYVTAESFKTVPADNGSFDCEDNDENNRIVEIAIQNLKLNADNIALNKCLKVQTNMFSKAMLSQDYNIERSCRAFGMMLGVKVSGVYECML